MLFVSTSATCVLCVHSLYVIVFNFLIQFHHIEENNTLQRQKENIMARIQSRTMAATKKLTIETITSKRAKQPDILEAEAEVCTIPVARYVNFVDLTTSSTDRKVLDPSECECPTCPYSTGCLATQRYVLLER